MSLVLFVVLVYVGLQLATWHTSRRSRGALVGYALGALGQRGTDRVTLPAA